MTNKLVVLALALMLGACGEQGGQTAAPESAGSDAAAPAEASPPEAPAAAPAAPSPAAEAPAAADDEVKYDPIDVTKLDNSWYKQFGGGN